MVMDEDVIENEYIRDMISSISIFNNDCIVLGETVKGRITNINDATLNSLDFQEYLSVVKAANIVTLRIKESSKTDIKEIESKLKLQLLYVDNIADKETLGISVSYAYKSGSESIEDYGLKIITIEENGLLYKKLGSKLRIGDTIVDINGISLENLSTKLACKLLHETINRKITILHFNNYDINTNNNDINTNNNEYINIKEDWAILKYNYLANRINKDRNDIKKLSYKYNLPPKFKLQRTQQLENLLTSYYKYQQLYQNDVN